MQTRAIIQAQFFWVIHTPLLLLSKQCVKKQREFYEFVVHNNFVVISIMSLKPFSEELFGQFSRHSAHSESWIRRTPPAPFSQIVAARAAEND